MCNKGSVYDGVLLIGVWRVGSYPLCVVEFVRLVCKD